MVFWLYISCSVIFIHIFNVVLNALSLSNLCHSNKFSEKFFFILIPCGATNVTNHFYTLVICCCANVVLGPQFEAGENALACAPLIV